MCERDEMKVRCDCGSLYAIHEINIRQKRTSVFSCACPSHCKCSCTYCICTIKPYIAPSKGIEKGDKKCLSL